MVQAVAQRLPPSLRAVAERRPAAITGLEVRGEDGRDHFFRERMARVRPTGGLQPDLYSVNQPVPLRWLTAEVRSLRRVSGVLALPAPARVSSVRIDLAAGDGKREVGGVELSWSPREDFGPMLVRTRTLALSADGPPDRLVAWQIREGGGPLCSDVVNCPGTQTTAGLPLTASECEVRVVEIARLPLEFSLSDVPATLRPARIEPLRFPKGRPPVRLEVRELVKGVRPLLYASNQTEKAVEEIRYRLRVVDDKGRLVGDGVKAYVFSHKLGPASERQPHLVQWESREPPASLSPGPPSSPSAPKSREPAVKLEVEVVGVVFVDGTTWSADRP
jgi:hypothetical protein